MANESLNTGVETALEAATQTGQIEYPLTPEYESDGEEETIEKPAEAEEPEEEVAEVETFLPQEDAKGTSENKGVTPPPEQKPEAKTEDQDNTKPDDYYRSQGEFDKAFSARLNKERAKIEQDVAGQLGVPISEAREIILETKAKKLIEQNPEMHMSLEFAKDYVKRGAEPVQPKQETAKDTTSGGFDYDAWAENVSREEAIIKAIDPEFSVEKYAAESEIFKTAMVQGKSTADAYKLAKESERNQRSQLEDVKKTAQKEVLEKIKSSGEKAMTNTAKGKGESRGERKYSDSEIATINARIKQGYVAKNPYA